MDQITESTLTIPDASTSLLAQEAENANLDLVGVRNILQNIWELLSEGRAVGNHHGLGISSNARASGESHSIVVEV
jgi:hypothetical protein